MIYLDHASTTYVLPEIITKIKEDLENNWANPSNIYKISETPKEIINNARKVIADCIGAKPHEIFFTSGASEGNAWVGIQRSKILCSPYEHHNLTTNEKSIIIDEDYLDQAITWKQVNSLNQISSIAFDNYLVSWMMVNNETGEIFDIKSICNKAHELGAYFHSDMTQALGNVHIDVKDLGVDFATFTGHKVHAPKGIGFIYINSDTVKTVNRLIYGGGQEFSLRAGTENVPYIDGLRMAVHSAILNRSHKNNHCLELKKLMVEELNKNSVNFIINSPGNSVPNILNISIKDISGENLMMDLSDRNIYCGTGSACMTGSLEPSEVLTAMGVSEDYIHGAIRFSFDNKNTKEEIVSVAKNIGDLVKQYNN